MKSKALSGRIPAFLVTAALSACLAACGTEQSVSTTRVAAPATYKLNSDVSELKFVTTKNTNVAEVQQFKRLSGEISKAGAATLVIDLASVETQIPLRNDRLREMLFEVARFPVAQFDAEVDMDKVNRLEVGGMVDVDVTGKLTMHGQTQAAVAPLRVVRLKGDKLSVTTRSPILVAASKFELSGGVEKLREVMGLPNIIGTVPVSFSLEFQKQS